MKLRRKAIDDTKRTWEVIEDSNNYYIAWCCEPGGTKWGPCFLSKADYEPVPEERWEDLTQSVRLLHDGHYLGVNGWCTAYLPSCMRWKCSSDGGLHLLYMKDNDNDR